MTGLKSKWLMFYLERENTGSEIWGERFRRLGVSTIAFKIITLYRTAFYLVLDLFFNYML